MLLNPKLYEINTRVWIKQFGEGVTLSQIPFSVFEDMAVKGINIIWLLGVWKTCEGLIDKCCFSVDLVSAYTRSLKDWRREDIIGSPFSIDSYQINPALGTTEELIELRRKLNAIGIKLFLDFEPNHFGAESVLIKSNPEIFLQGDKEMLKNDPFTFFEAGPDSRRIFAHGRDPLFPAWTDTVQVNYYSNQARDFMTNTLLQIAEVCDGVRCDMAMLQLNNIFQNTWLGVLNKTKFVKPKDEFWLTAIAKVKEKFPDFIFLAEAYWDLEWELQQLGFDFTYDKKLTDRLGSQDVYSIKAHLEAEISYQIKSARFLENHDEPRAITKFGKRRAYAAAVLMSTVPGMKLYFDGQFEGKKTKIPVQLGREPEEKISSSIQEHYNKILKITKDDIFIKGQWRLLDTIPVSENNSTYENMFAWEWKLDNDLRIIVINYSEETSQCRIKFDPSTSEKEILLIDQLNGADYRRSVGEINSLGLFVELKGYHSHIFSVVAQPLSAAGKASAVHLI